ncbi:unnamed protein product [Phytophthora lilii]|uniref:Unnamed protein product n=1 Tax=Phytophthora lilii TaxID=2077276 RepID=A0A9W6TL79_9STRA|nr:unnamed protein product [Phytophthora lilii]
MPLERPERSYTISAFDTSPTVPKSSRTSSSRMSNLRFFTRIFVPGLELAESLPPRRDKMDEPPEMARTIDNHASVLGSSSVKGTVVSRRTLFAALAGLLYDHRALLAPAVVAAIGGVVQVDVHAIVVVAAALWTGRERKQEKTHV